jgi:hypothetical protein
VLAEAILLASDRAATGGGARTAGAAARTEPREEPTGLAAEAPAAGGEAAARVWLVPQRLSVAPGEVFEVRLLASAVRPLSHLPLTWSTTRRCSPSSEVVAGDFLGAAGEAEVLSDTTTPGRLILGASRLGQRGGTRGAGTVARITFRAVADGRSRVRFAEARALDALLQPLAPFATEAMTVEVGEVPTPRRPDVRGVETEGGGPRPRS